MILEELSKGFKKVKKEIINTCDKRINKNDPTKRIETNAESFVKVKRKRGINLCCTHGEIHYEYTYK